MSEDWFALTPWELAALTRVDQRGAPQLDRVSTLGVWLAQKQHVEHGSELLARRRADQALDDDIWRALQAVASAVAEAEYVSVLHVEVDQGDGLTLITAVSDSAASQVLVRPGGCALRGIGWPVAAEAVAGELGEALNGLAPVEVTVARASSGEEPGALRWADGVASVAGDATTVRLPSAEALPAILAFALPSQAEAATG